MKEKLKSLIKKLTFRDYLLIIIAILAIVFGITSRYYKNKAYEAELALVTDTLHIYKNKLNEEYLARNIQTLTEKELKKQNSELSEELKSLKEHPLVITKTKVEVRVDTVYTSSDSIIKRDEEHKLVWHYDEPYFSIAGNTYVKNDFSSFQTQIVNLQIPATLTLDVIENKEGLIKIIGKSDNPYVRLTDTDGVLLDPTQSKAIKSHFRQKHWNIGPMIGVGLTSDLKIRPYIGVGITYGLINF